MEQFYIGRTFDRPAPPEAAEWCDKNRAHIEKADGVRTIVANPPPTQEDIINGYENAVQSHIDQTAQSRGYDNSYTCLSYLSSTVEVWRREANIFIAWRDQVWRKCHDVLKAFLAGEIPPPTVEELIAQLPVIEW